MNTIEESAAAAADGAEQNISHFIPSVELKGSRAEKLETLGTLIVYLERLRRSLVHEAAGVEDSYERPGRRRESPAWPWFTAGAFLGALFVVLLLLARGWGV